MKEQLRITKINGDNKSNLEVGKVYDIIEWTSINNISYPVINPNSSDRLRVVLNSNKTEWEMITNKNYPLNTEQKVFINQLLDWLRDSGKKMVEIPIDGTTEPLKEFSISSVITYLKDTLAENEYDEYDRRVLVSLRKMYIDENFQHHKFKKGDIVELVSTKHTDESSGYIVGMKSIGEKFEIDYVISQTGGVFDKNGYCYHSNDLEMVIPYLEKGDKVQVIRETNKGFYDGFNHVSGENSAKLKKGKIYTVYSIAESSYHNSYSKRWVLMNGFENTICPSMVRRVE